MAIDGDDESDKGGRLKTIGNKLMNVTVCHRANFPSFSFPRSGAREFPPFQGARRGCTSQIIHCTFAFRGLFIILTFESDVDIIETYFFQRTQRKGRGNCTKNTVDTGRQIRWRGERFWCVEGKVCSLSKGKNLWRIIIKKKIKIE